MASEQSGQGGSLARSIQLRLIGFAVVVGLVVAGIAESHGVLTGNQQVAFAMAGLAIIVAVGALTARGIAGPIRAVTTTMRALAAGTLEAKNPGQHRTDEIGDLARAAEVFRANAIELRRLTVQQMQVDRLAAADRRKALNAMAAAIERETSTVVARLAEHAKAAAVAGDVDGLLRTVRDGVGRAVRSASSDVERRRWPRIRLAGTADIEVDGVRTAAPIADVSAGGIRIGCALTAQVGQRCRVRLPGVAPELPAEILAVSQNEARLRFEIDEITRAVVNRMLEDVSRERATAA